MYEINNSEWLQFTRHPPLRINPTHLQRAGYNTNHFLGWGGGISFLSLRPVAGTIAKELSLRYNLNKA